MKTIHIPSPTDNVRSAGRVTEIRARIYAGWHSLKPATVLLVLLSLGAGRALGSDPIGIYALVDKAVFEPNETNPERIQIWGAFAIAEGYGYTYKKAERGYLYYKVNPDKPTACRNEWTDMKSIAGTGQIIAFGSRYGEKGTLRKKDAKPEKPDLYPVAMGLTKIKDVKDYEPLKQLAKLRDEKPHGKNPPDRKNPSLNVSPA